MTGGGSRPDAARWCPPTGDAGSVAHGLTRRRLLTAVGAGAAATMAGCLDDGADGEDGADGDKAGAPFVENLGTLELSVTDDGATPGRVRVATDATVTVQVRNESDERHVVAGSDPGFPELAVDPGTLANEVWEVPVEPQTVAVDCTTHDQSLAAVDVEPMDVGGGCPSG